MVADVSALTTDFYELTMMQGYFLNNENPDVVFDMFYRKNPFDGGYAVFAGLGEMLSERMRLLPEGGAVIILPQSFFDRHGLLDGETEGFVNLPLSIKGVRLSVLAREDGGQFRVSIRSKRGTSARLLAKNHFHGGGHEQASGGRILMPQDIADASAAEAYVTDITARFLQEQVAV